VWYKNKNRVESWRWWKSCSRYGSLKSPENLLPFHTYNKIRLGWSGWIKREIFFSSGRLLFGLNFVFSLAGFFLFFFIQEWSLSRSNNNDCFTDSRVLLRLNDALAPPRVTQLDVITIRNNPLEYHLALGYLPDPLINTFTLFFFFLHYVRFIEGTPPSFYFIINSEKQQQKTYCNNIWVNKLEPLRALPC
jgi:hypothetical protein